ncbi:MAG: type II toxin-antitoxin system prevent-host-death family antitoxin [Deltaproteobacteria bacterium]|nr:type II toxin-antitoxin system prevent-host-death family antitoxin [Deltaproteobacteria bacterium]
MKSVGSYEAKTHLPALLEKVSLGERITITRHGMPIAYLIPAKKFPATPVKEIIQELKKFNQDKKLGRLKISSLKAEGRR